MSAVLTMEKVEKTKNHNKQTKNAEYQYGCPPAIYHEMTVAMITVTS